MVRNPSQVFPEAEFRRQDRENTGQIEGKAAGQVINKSVFNKTIAIYDNSSQSLSLALLALLFGSFLLLGSCGRGSAGLGAGSAFSSDEVDDGSDHTQGVPQSGVVQAGDFSQTSVVLHPEEDEQGEKSWHFEEPASKDNEQEGAAEKADDGHSEVLLHKALNFRGNPFAMAAGEGGVELSIETVDGRLVLEEQESLENESSDDEELAEC